MLRAVCFKNFVKFNEHQSIVFQDDSPFLFIGENGSGKSSVLEGIRRCLTNKLSTSVSSSFDKRYLSYFICEFESPENNRIISGYLVMPENPGQMPNSGASRQSKKHDDETLGENKHEYYTENLHKKLKLQTNLNAQKEQATNLQIQPNRASEFYKFAMECCDNSQSGKTYINLMEVSTVEDTLGETTLGKKTVGETMLGETTVREKTLGEETIGEKTLGETTQGEKSICLKRRYELLNDDLQRKIEAVFNGELKDTDFESYLLSVFREELSISEGEAKDCEAILEELSANIVFTFPLRSVGPLQWSESSRISNKYRQENYKEAEDRCEIIRCFLEDKDENKFYKETEELYFKRITQSDDYNFELKDGKISLPEGKYELLKTPEGILEAKTFSILMSSKNYKTLVLEEPDKGMHPQFIERMLQIMKENKRKKRVLLTTHNKTFITPWTVPSCCVFRRIEDTCYFISGKSIVSIPRKENGNMKRLRLLTTDHLSDILFARKVLFYEGDSEMLFLTELRNQILAGETSIKGVLGNDTGGYDRLQKNLTEFTLIKMHSKDNLEFCEEMCDKLKIASIFLVDRDAVFKITMAGKSKVEKRQEKDAAKVRSPDDWCRIRNELIKQRHIFFWIDGTIEDMVRKMTDHDEELSASLRQQNYAPSGKLFLGDNVESEHVRESVRVIIKHCKPKYDLAKLIKLLESDICIIKKEEK